MTEYVQLLLPLTYDVRLPHELPLDKYGNRLPATLAEAMQLSYPRCLELPCGCEVCQRPAALTLELRAARHPKGLSADGVKEGLDRSGS